MCRGPRRFVAGVTRFTSFASGAAYAQPAIPRTSLSTLGPCSCAASFMRRISALRRQGSHTRRRSPPAGPSTDRGLGALRPDRGHGGHVRSSPLSPTQRVCDGDHGSRRAPGGHVGVGKRSGYKSTRTSLHPFPSFPSRGITGMCQAFRLDSLRRQVCRRPVGRPRSSHLAENRPITPATTRGQQPRGRTSVVLPEPRLPGECSVSILPSSPSEAHGQTETRPPRARHRVEAISPG